MPRTVVKLGSSVVAHPDGSSRSEVFARVGAAVADARGRGEDVVLVSSGAIAHGLPVLGLGARPSAIADLQALSAVGQLSLFRRWDDALREAGVVAAQVLLTSLDLAGRTSYVNARKTLETLLEWRAVPVVNENDTTTTDEISFGDNDFLAAQVAILVGADRLVLLTEVEGLFTSDPREDPAASLVESVEDPAALGALSIGEGTSALGSGGMRSKVRAAEIATAAGIPTVVCSGLVEGALEAVLAGGRAGTAFAAAASRASSFKLWLKYAKPPQGVVEVDAGAARALRDGGTSLLPVGIVEVRGAFDVGDAVEVAAPDGAVLGKGIVSYSAEELRRVRGLQSAAVREVLPHATDEAVHRDHFVLA